MGRWGSITALRRAKEIVSSFVSIMSSLALTGYLLIFADERLASPSLNRWQQGRALYVMMPFLLAGGIYCGWRMFEPHFL